MLRYSGSNIEIVVHIINLPLACFLHVSTPKDKTLPELHLNLVLGDDKVFIDYRNFNFKEGCF